MCVIAVALKRELPIETLRRCEQANAHGAGVAWADGKKVHWVKGITAEQALELVKDKPFPHVYHFRIASVGSVRQSLCHPFPVRLKDLFELSGEEKSVLFHNGTVQNWKYLSKVAGVKVGDDFSDSSAMAKIVALRGPDFLNETPGKWCLMNADGTLDVYGGFEKHDGALFSNMFWKYSGDRAYRMHRQFQDQTASGYSGPAYQRDMWPDGSPDCEPCSGPDLPDVEARVVQPVVPPPPARFWWLQFASMLYGKAFDWRKLNDAERTVLIAELERDGEA
jgi:predicted glutamine amidotransferase